MTIKTQEIILDHAVDLIRPLSVAAENPKALERLLGFIGWDAAAAGLAPTDIQTAFEACKTVAEQVEALIENGVEDIGVLAQGLQSIASGFEAVRGIAGNWQNPGDLPASAPQTFVEDLLFWLLDVYMNVRIGRALAVLELVGLITRTPHDGISRSNGTVIRRPMVRMRVDFAQAGQMLQDPIGLIRDRFVNGENGRRTADAAFDLLAPFLVQLLDEFGLNAFYGTPGASADPRLTDAQRALAARFLYLTYLFVPEDAAAVISRLDAIISLVEIDSAFALIVAPVGALAVDTTIGPLTFKLTAQGTIQPLVISRSGVSFQDEADPQLALDLTVGRHPLPEEGPLLRLGGERGTRFVVSHMDFHLLANLQPGGTDLDLLYQPGGASLTIARSDGDGFLNKVLPEQPITIPFDLGIGWSKTKGLYFSGGATLEVSLPIHQDLFGVLKIDTVDLALTAAGETGESPELRLMAAVTASLKLGPLAASVEKLGLKGIIAFPKDGGNLGPANFSLGFKPPDGAGMVLDAKVVTGGGYIEFNPDEEQYAGILQLEIEDMISIKAIALLTTRVPGLPPGDKGFSLLVILTAEFPPIQLGYGFALLGVGGLFGVNRTMLLDPLRDGIKNHTVDSILFPKDPVENAQRIISDLRSIFPPADGRFVLGPMVKLSWGTPAIITGELGILLELPAPIRLAILGKLTLALPPVPGAEVLIIQMDVIGAIDFDKRDASIDATLVDSRVATFPLTGDMAMRLNWGPSPVFALSAGGFHPRFQPPPNFPGLSRLAISLATGDNPRLRLEAYMAVTASTAMMGARLDAYVEQDLGELIGKLTVQAYLSFDTLVQFSPFSLIAEMKGAATLKRKVEGQDQNLLALTLAITLTGPQPWHAWGEARFEFLGKHRIGFDVTIGQPAGTPAKISISPLDELVKALSDPHAWSAQLPDERHMLATIRRIEPGEDEVLVHPLGSLTLRQRVVPLGLDLEKYGEANIAGARRFDFDVALAGPGAAAADLTKQPVKDSFSAAQFFEMSDDEKLGRPAFESFPSGYRWTTVAGVSAGDAVTSSLGYETVVIDAKDSFDRHKEDQPYILHGAVLQAAYGLGAAALSSMRSTGGARFAGPATQKVVVGEPAFAVADKVNLQTQSGARTVTTYTEAELARRKQRDRAGYQVVASHEVRNA